MTLITFPLCSQIASSAEVGHIVTAQFTLLQTNFYFGDHIMLIVIVYSGKACFRYEGNSYFS